MVDHAQALVHRWSTAEGVEKRRQVLEAWSHRAPLDPARLGVVGGRIDLRGLAVPPSAQRARFADVEIRGVDLSGSRLTGVTFSGCDVTDVVVDDAQWRDVGLVGCRVTACSLERSVLTQCLLSTGDPDLYRDPPVQRGTVFVDCTFRRTQLHDTVCTFATFESVDFDDCRISAAQFYNSSFSRARFSGSLDGVDFTGRPGAHAGPTAARAELVEVSFTHARSRDLNVDHVRLDHVRWPRGRRYVIIAGQVHDLLSRIRDAAASVGEFESGYLSDHLDYVWPDQREYVIFTDLFAATPDPREHQLELAAERALIAFAGRSGLEVRVDRHIPSD